MVAILQSGTRQIAAMVTVEQHTGKVTKIDTIDLAHALNGRIAKKKVAYLPQGTVTLLKRRPMQLPSL